jgi:hypothetical protein
MMISSPLPLGDGVAACVDPAASDGSGLDTTLMIVSPNLKSEI